MTADELNVLWLVKHIESVDFHAGYAGYMLPSRIRAMETALNTAFVSLGGTGLNAPIDGVTAEPGYVPQRTVEVFNAKVDAIYPSAEILARNEIATVLLQRGWTTSVGFPYVLPLTLA